MKKLMTILYALSLLTTLALAQNAAGGQAAAPGQDAAKQDNMKSDTSEKASSITGKISEDGKSFVSDKDGKSYTISNPDSVKGHEGHHVTLKAKVSSDSTSVDVVSLKMAGGSESKDMSK